MVHSRWAILYEPDKKKTTWDEVKAIEDHELVDRLTVEDGL